MKLKKLNKEDIKIFSKYFENKNYNHSPYSLSGIFLWDDCIWDVYWIEYENYLIISEVMKNSLEKRIFLPIPYDKLLPEKLIEILKNINYDVVYYVTEEYINLNKDKIEKFFYIEKNSFYSDYVYLSEELSSLKGAKFSSKRNLINQFIKNYLSYIKIEKITEEKINDIIEFSKNIMEKSKDDSMLECEFKAISKIKEFYSDIEFFGTCIYINEEIKGFAIGSVLNKDTCILNFEKADKNIKGLYQFLDREFAKLVNQRFKYINKESDLGLETLQKSKLSYNPVKIIDSFILKPKI